MTKFVPSSKLIISLLAALLVLFFLVSINRYKISFRDWQEKINELRLASYELDTAIHKVRGGLRVDYDQLVENDRRLKSLSSGLGHRKANNTVDAYSISDWILIQREIDIPFDKVEALVAERTLLLETFKTNFSIFRNSSLILLQLISELKSIANPLLHSELQSLESSILLWNQIQGGTGRKEIESKLETLISNYPASGFPEVHKLIGFIKNHFEMVVLSELKVNRVLNDEVRLQEMLMSELDLLEKEIIDQHNIEILRSDRFSYLFFFTAFVVLFFSIVQSRKSYLLKNQLAAHNINLATQIKLRTANLESAKNKLQVEKREREQLLTQLEESKKKLDALINNIHGCVIEFDISDGSVHYISDGVEGIWGVEAKNVKNVFELAEKVHPEDIGRIRDRVQSIINDRSVANMEYRVIKEDQNTIWVREICSVKVVDGMPKALVSVAVDITEFKQASEEKKRIEKELVHAQKLESVGQLAAGIAHEINTPAQFISDNLVFLQESVGEVLQLIADIRGQVSESKLETLVNSVDGLCEQADLEYLSEEILPALKQSSDGISSISKIIRAMKDYSHPGETVELADINKAIDSTITISRTEWKYFAVLETEFDEALPMVECVISDINQVVLNMIVNAAHAVVEKYDDPDNLQGKIIIRTKSMGDKVAIEISDNGAGMPESVRVKIFDHFFTTKEVGKGTGQGLSLAYRMIVEKHKGSIDVDSEEGVGTTFRILLPTKHPETVDGGAEEIDAV